MFKQKINKQTCYETNKIWACTLNYQWQLGVADCAQLDDTHDYVFKFVTNCHD